MFEHHLKSKEMFDVHLMQTKSAGGGFRSVGGPWIRYLMVTRSRFAGRVLFPGQKMNYVGNSRRVCKTRTKFHIRLESDSMPRDEM